MPRPRIRYTAVTGYPTYPDGDKTHVLTNETPYETIPELIELLKQIVARELNVRYNDPKVQQDLNNAYKNGYIGLRNTIMSILHVIRNGHLLSQYSGEDLDFHLYRVFFKEIAHEKSLSFVKQQLNIDISNPHKLKINWFYILNDFAQEQMALLLMLKYGWKFKRTHVIYQHIFHYILDKILHDLFKEGVNINTDGINHMIILRNKIHGLLDESLVTKLNQLQSKEIDFNVY